MKFLILFLIVLFSFGCKKTQEITPVIPENFSFVQIKINNSIANGNATNVSFLPVIKLTFSDKINHGSTEANFAIKSGSGVSVTYTVAYENDDSTVFVKPSQSLQPLSRYLLTVSAALSSQKGGKLTSPVSFGFLTSIDSSDKFPTISDNALLDKVQQQTFKYFWEFGHPVSGLARERNTSGDLVTTGGSGFGIMAIVTAISRNFITRADGLARMQTIVSFLKNNAQKFHGAFPHWLNGSTGAIIPFSQNDNGADIVETSYLMEGLLTARQYFNNASAAETTLRADINTLWNGVEWDWFRKSNENVLYWHWSPDKNWIMNVQLKGWNEALITYVMAAASTTHTIPKIVYDNGWASNGGFANGNVYYGKPLPLGPALGGSLFFAHYSFLGINPNGLSDAYANYQTQNTNHTLINYSYCVANPKGFYGYSSNCWGLTASDDNQVGYLAHEPNNDDGVISPTAALSSFPYTPVESMNALHFFYYKLGDKLWGGYGFADAFSLNDPWFADSYLAIDQGPIIVMIENYRSGLLWNLFTSCTEVKAGMIKLGFSAPYL